MSGMWLMVSLMRSKYLIVSVVSVLVVLIAAYAYFTWRQAREPAGWLFTVDVNGERFKVLVRDPSVADELRKMLRGERRGIVIGELRSGDGGFNKPWSWHLDPDTISVADVAIELCDGTPSFVESELDYWLNVVKRYCPWNTKIVAEEPWFKPS
ncbi:MAG: hypothetical protein LM561_02805 [Desulfurococcaceae archaeon]|nr:hypothetical protein [Desulfurococcaceae archaeon]